MKFKKHILLIASLVIFLFGKAQLSQYPYSFDDYSFINFPSNTLSFTPDTSKLNLFFESLAQLNFQGQGQINIVHIGGSHVQADILTNQLRMRFQSFQGGMNAGRGFVFPYRIAKTNSPSGYYFITNGNWEACRNVDKYKFCKLGMAGISAITHDSLSSLTLVMRKENIMNYEFNRLKIFYEADSLSFTLRIDSNLVASKIYYPASNYVEYNLTQFVDSLLIEFVKTDSSQNHFTLYGMVAESNESGIEYHGLGINGASTTSFLQCSEFENQLKVIKPQLVIMGLGINDAYGKEFSQEAFEANYTELIRRIRTASPDAAILLITNNDSYLFKRKVNKNGLKVQESMMKIAKENQAQVWDMFEIMGGLNSIVQWQKTGLAQKDKVHLTRIGYTLMGDLFFDAIIKSYGNYLYSKYQLKKDSKSDE